jgi:ribonuclease-3
VAFRDPALLRLALTHRSYVHERHAEAPESNERLEFLGDALLGLVIAEALYRRHPHAPEGLLTEYRSQLVRAETLAETARGLGLGEHLCLGHGEEASGGRTRTRNLARALEAVIGAIFLDRGYLAAKRWTLRLFREPLASFEPERVRDAKSVLQETVQAQGRPAPLYRTLASEGPDHLKDFTVEVLVGERPLAQGRGSTKRQAQEAAARAALARLADRDGRDAH